MSDAPTPELPTDRMRELEKQMRRIRSAAATASYHDFWEHGGRSSASDATIAAMDAELADAMSDKQAAKAALAALVPELRATAPRELIAWTEAHDAYLLAFLADIAGDRDDDAVAAANRERAEWAEVRDGTRTCVDEDHYRIKMNEERYRKLFGIDPYTPEPTQPSS